MARQHLEHSIVCCPDRIDQTKLLQEHNDQQFGTQVGRKKFWASSRTKVQTHAHHVSATWVLVGVQIAGLVASQLHDASRYGIHCYMHYFVNSLLLLLDLTRFPTSSRLEHLFDESIITHLLHSIQSMLLPIRFRFSSS
jgi:hypothetical protein